MDIPQKQIKGKLIQLYSDEFKKAVCEEYLKGTSSKMDIQRKYRICYKSAIVTWLRKFGYAKQPPSHYPVVSTLHFMGKSNKDTQALEQKIKMLEQQLADAELKVVVYDKLIEVAERDLNISIRKKRNTKQSTK
jgi:transposase